MINNYDQSSTGINIELNIHYDCDQARNELEDFIQEPEVLTLRDRRGCIDYIVLAPDLSAPYRSLSALRRMTKEQLTDLLQLMNLDTGYDFPKRELIDELRHVTKAEYLTELHRNTPYRDLPYTYNANGYSQGDSCRVYDMYPEGKAPYDREYIHHILWDAPIYGTLSVNDEEYYIDQYLDNSYEYDTEALLRNLADRTELSPEALQQIEKLLPSELEYSL